MRARPWTAAPYALEHAVALASMLDADPEALHAELSSMPGEDGLTRDGTGAAIGGGTHHVVAVDGDDVGARAAVWRLPDAPAGWFASDFRVRPPETGALDAVVRAQRAWLGAVGATTLRTAVDDGDRALLEGLVEAGFSVEAHVVLGRRELGPENPLSHALRIAPAEDAPEVRAGLHALWGRTLVDNPGHIDPLPSLDSWSAEVFDDPGFRPEWLLEARDGDRLVGATWATAAGDGHAYIEYTCVERDARRRGVARALKAELAARLRAGGVRTVETEWAVENGPIARINRDEGFVVVGGHRRLALSI